MSDVEWDKDDKSIKVGHLDKWKDEDTDDVKDNWDDDDEEDVKENGAKPVVSAKAAANKKNLKSKTNEKSSKQEAESVEDSRPKTQEELLQERLEQQRLQEESDLRLAKEAFGGADSMLDLVSGSKEDFEVFKTRLVQKLAFYEKSQHYVGFLEGLFRDLCATLPAEDIKKISNNLNALWNEKVKAQKASTKPKKKSKGYAIKVERDALAGEGTGVDYEDDYDDFM